MADVEHVNFNERWVECWACGAGTPYRWGLPHDDCGDLVPNEYQGETGNYPCCERCYEAHAQGLLTAGVLREWRRRCELEHRATMAAFRWED